MRWSRWDASLNLAPCPVVHDVLPAVKRCSILIPARSQGLGSQPQQGPATRSSIVGYHEPCTAMSAPEFHRGRPSQRACCAALMPDPR